MSEEYPKKEEAPLSRLIFGADADERQRASVDAFRSTAVVTPKDLESALTAEEREGLAMLRSRVERDREIYGPRAAGEDIGAFTTGSAAVGQSPENPGAAAVTFPPADPRLLVINAASPEDAAKLAMSVAVAQEVAVLLDAVDREGLSALDLTGWSRLRAVSECWWLTCGFKAEDLDRWIADLREGEEEALLAPAVAVPDALPGADASGRRRLVNVVSGRASEIGRLYAELEAGTAAPPPALPADPPPAFRAAVASLIADAYGLGQEGVPDVRATVAALWTAAHQEGEVAP